MADFSGRLGDNHDLDFVVLDDPADLAGSWTWDGSLLVLGDDTSGVVVGDWIQAPAGAGGVENEWFKVTVVDPNVSATIENPRGYDVPSTTGAAGASPIDLTNGVVEAVATLANRDAWRSTNITDPDGVEMTDAAAGEGTWHITPNDQHGQPEGSYDYKIVTTRRGALRDDTAGSGETVDIAADGVITFSGSAVVPLAEIADVLDLTTAATVANQKNVTVVDTPTTDNDLASNQLRVNYEAFTAELASDFGLYRGIRKTPDGLCGTLPLRCD